MRTLRAIDGAVLAFGDQMVAFAWTRFGLRKFDLVRFFALAFVIGAFLQARSLGQPIPAAVVGGISLACWTIWEISERRSTALASNLSAQAIRQTWLGVILRYLALAVLATPPFTPANVASALCLVALVLCAQALSPDETRESRKAPRGGQLVKAVAGRRNRPE